MNETYQKLLTVLQLCEEINNSEKATDCKLSSMILELKEDLLTMFD